MIKIRDNCEKNYLFLNDKMEKKHRFVGNNVKTRKKV